MKLYFVPSSKSLTILALLIPSMFSCRPRASSSKTAAAGTVANLAKPLAGCKAAAEASKGKDGKPETTKLLQLGITAGEIDKEAAEFAVMKKAIAENKVGQMEQVAVDNKVQVEGDKMLPPSGKTAVEFALAAEKPFVEAVFGSAPREQSLNAFARALTTTNSPNGARTAQEMAGLYSDSRNSDKPTALQLRAMALGRVAMTSAASEEKLQINLLTGAALSLASEADAMRGENKSEAVSAISDAMAKIVVADAVKNGNTQASERVFDMLASNAFVGNEAAAKVIVADVLAGAALAGVAVGQLSPEAAAELTAKANTGGVRLPVAELKAAYEAAGKATRVSESAVGTDALVQEANKVLAIDSVSRAMVAVRGALPAQERNAVAERLGQESCGKALLSGIGVGESGGKVREYRALR